MDMVGDGRRTRLARGDDPCRINQWDMAADLFEAAVHGRPNGYRRGMLNDAAHLVHALVRVRSWRRAHQVLADTVVPALGQIRSGRTTTLLVHTQRLMEQTGAPLGTGAGDPRHRWARIGVAAAE